LAFWVEAANPQHTLAFGTPEDVREKVRYNIGVFTKGGGYVFNNPHNIQSNVTPESMTALYNAANEFGKYESEDLDET
jgi:uroporphyrinogen decarboxylase